MKRHLIARIIIVMLAVLFILPIFSTVASSFMSPSQIADSGTVHLIPERFSLNQYYTLVFYKATYFDYFKRSIFLTSAIIIGQIVIGIFAAYALAKINFKGRSVIMGLYILVLLLPFQVTMVPNYLFFDTFEKLTKVELLNTPLALLLPGVFHSFGIFLMRQFIVDIPNEVIEAARVDGAGELRILFQIVIPTIKSGIMALVILTFIDYWNLIEQALVFISDSDKMPLSVFLDRIYNSDYNVYYAAAVLYIIPAAWLILKGQKYLMETSFKELK